MIDIHCHILPGIDDGALSMTQALDMADIAVSSGVSAICVTPHTNLPGIYRNYESSELKRRFLQLQAELDRERIPLRLLRGAEVFATSEMTELLKNGMIATMNYTKQCLIEFDFEERPAEIEAQIKGVLRAGFRPIIAHPERYDAIQENPELLYDWVQLGLLTQVNKGSVLGEFGPSCERCADYLLDRGLVTCIASDAHDSYERDTNMREIARYLRHEYGEDVCEHLLRINPGKMIRYQG